MDYNDYIAALGANLPQNVVAVSGVNTFQDPEYQLMIPRGIEQAELRMYRDPDLDFLATRTTDSSQTTVAGQRLVEIPPQMVVVEGINLILPAGAAPDQAGSSRVRLTRVKLPVLDVMWPEISLTMAPLFGVTSFAIFDQQEAANAPAPASSFRIGPTPDDAYKVECLGTFRPAPLAQTADAETFLTTYLPDLFLAASMIFWTGFLKDYGAQTDDPKMALSWMQVYESLKTGAAVEEARKKSEGAAWSPFPAASAAQSPRS